MKLTKKQTEEKNEAIENLRKWLPKGATLYTQTVKVSKSGMSRIIRVLCFARDENGAVSLYKGEPVMLHPNHSVALALGYSRTKTEPDGIKMTGCGMDMGFALVYSLSYKLHGDGYAINHRWL